jgi:hypothetical protein
MSYPLVLDLAAGGVPVAVTCRVLGFSKQAFYAWKGDPVPQRDWDDAHLINAALDVHRDDPAFGYRFIADELPARGITAGENRVARLCSQQQVWSVFARRRGLVRKAGPPVHDDLVRRQFSASQPDQTWLTDITEHPTAQGKLYPCAIKDACSNRIVGYPVDSQMKSPLAVTALHNAMRCCRKCAGPPALARPRPAAPGDHHLDRADLPPAPTATRPRTNDAHRVRDNQPGRTRGLNHPAPESTKAGAVPDELDVVQVVLLCQLDRRSAGSSGSPVASPPVGGSTAAQPAYRNPAVIPPSQTNTAPVTYEASSDARKA